jgi:membrane protease subunit (stomatin/prohibitin family)
MSEFLEILEWADADSATMVHRIPAQGSADLKLGAQLIVREHQAAIFVRDGKGLDVLGPGRHTLSTQNLPVLTKVLSLPWGFKSPFRAEVYFIALKVFTNLRWGTPEPVAFKDSELGLIRLRAFGTFTMRITQPLLFINTLVGARGAFETAEVESYLREIIVSRLNDFLGETVDTLLNLPRYYDEMGVAVKSRLRDDFGKYGMELVDFFINRITPPEDVQKRMDERAGMAAVGNLDQFLKFKVAAAVGDAARNGGTGNGVGADASAGMGLGVGAGLGMMIPGMLFKVLGGDGATVEQALERGHVNCPSCFGEVALDSRFCAHCGHQLVVMRKCQRCDKDVTPTARFCPACGLDLSTQHICRHCQTTLPPGTKFCLHCGESVAAP